MTNYRELTRELTSPARAGCCTGGYIALGSTLPATGTPERSRTWLKYSS